MYQRLWRVSLALILALVFSGVKAGPTTAYELAPTARFAPNAISDGVLTVCYGSWESEGIYVNRSLIHQYLTATFAVAGLTFVSNGLCDNDNSNVWIRWERSWTCEGGPLGQNNGLPWQWWGISIYLNADCNIDGKWDWTSNGPDGGWGQSTNDYQYSIQTTAAHEMLHALGLGHSNAPWSLVSANPWCPVMGASQGLDRDDTNGIKDEYNDDPAYAPWINWVGNAPVRSFCWG